MRYRLQPARALVLRNNVIAEGPDSGVWPDCSGNGITIYGNTIYRVRGDGFYIEAGVYGTILRWNTVFDSGSGITFRENFGNNAFENYIFRTGRALGIGTCDQNNLPKSNVMMYNWLIDNGMGAAFGPDVSGEPAHVFDHNVYKFQDWPDVDLRTRKPAVTAIDKNVNVDVMMDNWPHTKLRGQFWSAGPEWSRRKRRASAGSMSKRTSSTARLSVDGAMVACRGESKVPSSSKEKEYRLPLKAGDHEITLEFYHGTADNLWKGCIFSWQPPGEAKAVVPENVLFHKESAAADLQPGLKAEFFDIRGGRMPIDPMTKAVILQFGNKQYKDLPSLRAELGLEIHGKVVSEFDPSTLGLVTFRVHDTKKHWEPVPMIGNPMPNRGEVVNAYSPDFWRRGSLQGTEDFGWHSAGCGFGSETRGDDSAFVRMYVADCHWDVMHQFDDPAGKPAKPGYIFYLQVGAVPKRSISAEGFGYWSPELPTVDGAVIDLSLWPRLKDVKSVGDGGGLFVVAEFRDETGQNVTRQYLAGADPAPARRYAEQGPAEASRGGVHDGRLPAQETLRHRNRSQGSPLDATGLRPAKLHRVGVLQRHRHSNPAGHARGRGRPRAAHRHGQVRLGALRPDEALQPPAD